MQIDDAARSPKQTFAYGDEVRIRVDVAFHEANPAPCFGIQIKSADDIVLWTCDDAAHGARAAAARLRARGQPTNGGFARISAADATSSRSGPAMSGPVSTTGIRALHYAGHFDVLPEPRRGSGWLEPAASFMQCASAAIATRVST